jgi:hypothetical protein
MRIKGTYLMNIMMNVMGSVLFYATVESYLWDKNWTIQRNFLNILFLLIIALMKYLTHRNHHYIPHGVFAFAIGHFVLAFERELQFDELP